MKSDFLMKFHLHVTEYHTYTPGYQGNVYSYFLKQISICTPKNSFGCNQFECCCKQRKVKVYRTKVEIEKFGVVSKI